MRKSVSGCPFVGPPRVSFLGLFSLDRADRELAGWLGSFEISAQFKFECVFGSARILGQSKTTTAEELHRLIISKKTTYEEIRRIDPHKFADLEATMRMLFDHGNMTFDDRPAQPIADIPPPNASLREPAKPGRSRGDKIGKRKARPEPIQAAKEEPRPEKAPR